MSCASSSFRPTRNATTAIRPRCSASYGAAQAHDKAARHPGFHKTYSVDYAIVIEGEIWALMDVGETLMKVGDVLIQRGTNHAWANRTDRIARGALRSERGRTRMIGPRGLTAQIYRAASGC